jgi:hypothetical protein
MDPTFDYTLKIEFERCNLKDLQDILKILYNSSEESQKDILEMADEIVYRINIIGYDLKDPKYKRFCEFVKYLFDVLKRIRAEKQVLEIHKFFNHYIKEEPFSPIIESPKSPESTEAVEPPRIMRKVKKTILRRD